MGDLTSGSQPADVDGDERGTLVQVQSRSELSEVWPSLPLDAWRDTYATLHLWTQIVGKVRLALSPPLNHWWAVTLYVTPRGLTTTSIPNGRDSFEVAFDFLDHMLWVRASTGGTRAMALYPRSVADFYREFMAILRSLGIEVTINPLPQEIKNPIRCDEDEEHAAYDADYATRWWRILVQSERVLQPFRARFLGKSSPVHFFWGSFDLALTRFSGRRAPERPGADHVTREAYSHELWSCGFWPGTPGGPVAEAAFYAYMAPEPPGFAEAVIQPSACANNREMGEFILPYETVRTATDPDAMLLDFVQSTYEAGATLAGWDRAALER
ncbi:MAG TPA: DUF5996 family protein [Ktedonobacterales bacterium]|nr:DUF5996 family protein [Ktedonobacterales bacterium]